MRFSVALSRRMIVYGAPLTLMPCVWLVVNQSGGVFLTHYGSLSSAGIYALVMQCAQVLLVAVILPFRDAWEPGQFEVARDPAGGRVYRRMFQTVTFTIVMAAFTFAVGAEDVIRVLAAPAFHAAAAVVPILLAAHVVTGMSLFFNSALLASNRTALLGLIALVTAAVNLAGNMVLVPRYLAAGAAISRLVAVIVMAALTYAIARRVWPHRVDLVALAKLIVLALAGFGVSRLLPDETLVVSLAIKALLVVALVAASLLVGAVDRGDVARVSAFLRGRLSPWRRRAAAGTVR